MSQRFGPNTPKVITPTPTQDGPFDSAYFPPRTRSAAKQQDSLKVSKKDKERELHVDGERRARSRDRSPQTSAIRRRGGNLPSIQLKSENSSLIQKSEPLISNDVPNGFLSPASAAKTAQHYWREISRSPSPLGLIPIHVSWRSFVHRHEVPRKVLHVSIGFFTIWLFMLGKERKDIYPWLLRVAIPITLTDVIRHRSQRVNRFYVRVLGALMRETEVDEKYNGVIFYLLGVWSVQRFFHNDIAVMSVLLLSWCDTAASTIGRLYGRYTPRIRNGKSFAGSAAAAFVGILTSLLFYCFFVPLHRGIEESFLFKGYLQLPKSLYWLSTYLGTGTRLTGWAAYFVLSLVTGFIASFSEAVDLFGIDDNLTIPLLSGMGLWTFLTIFG